METLCLDLPSMYGDHHVLEVRALLSSLPGIDTVYASSAFRIVEVMYDPAQIDAQTITDDLADAGYLEELQLPTEIGAAANGQTKEGLFFRHTTAYQQAGSTVSFGQGIAAPQSGLWPCPGFGPLTQMDEED